jgi:predicted RNA binding protein YcfA (HicA-like mRNA interferase family)
VTAQEVIRRLNEDGWYPIKQTGSHRKFKHDAKPGIVTVPMHRGDIPKGTLGNIYRQAGWDK